jgi:hypothetical protein
LSYPIRIWFPDDTHELFPSLKLQNERELMAMARACRRQAVWAALLALLVLGLCVTVDGKGKKAKTKAKGAAGAAAPTMTAANIDLSAQYSAKQYGKAIPITPQGHGAIHEGRQSIYGVKEAQILKSPCIGWT